MPDDSGNVSQPEVQAIVGLDEKIESLDFTDDSSVDISKFKPTEGAPYDPKPYEDKARRIIAYALIALLFVLIFGILGLVACKVILLTDIKEFAVILGPVVTLVSAATGFYYGTKN